ncbi:PAS domain S-box protein [Hymenobacter arizonensis]|uniref:histidine kinase n=1 Tax=Hymenobacter arizonensis TaxID=1227077 RepID=A0A1I5Z4H5_HYMAR|nr:PAS domain S-box protein [Hymenobacter arizonensis]SFQ51352.1 PAS domain S-box-containing protein [Hymenobacter arizonensis]
MSSIPVVSSSQPVAPPTSALFDQLGQMYLMLDTQGIIVETNEAFLAMVGYPRERVIGQVCHHMFAPPAERKSRLKEFLESVATESLAPSYERPILTRGGQLRQVHWRGGFTRSETGAVTGVWMAGQEPSDRRMASAGLSGDSTHLQDFLDNAQDLVQHLSADNSFLFVNKAWKEKLGYTDAELATRTLADVVHPYYKAKLLYQLRNLYDGEPVNKVETVFLTNAGKPVHLIGSMSVVREEGQPVSSRAILHDITDRIKAERLQKVYYSIANLAISAKDLPSLYGAIHRELSKIIETSNLFIALCDDARTQLQFAYHVDQHPQHRPQGAMPFTSGVSEYIIGGGQPRYLTHTDFQQLIRNGTITAYGLVPEVMLASPLSIGDRIIGVLAVQDYNRADAYTPGDLDVLHFISNQVALAIERKRNEEQIGKQTARLNAIFESGSHVMWTVDTRAHLMNYNRNYAALFLRRNGTYPVRGLDLWEADLAHMPEGERNVFVKHYEAAAKGQAQRFEMGLRDSRGNEVWTDIYLNPIYLGDGSFEEISAIAHDITEQKRAQLALEAQEEKFRTIFESFQDIYYRTDEHGVVTIVSPSVQEVLGYKPEEVIGKLVKGYYVDPQDLPRASTEIDRNGSLRNFETQMWHKEGYPVSLLVNARMVESTGYATEGIARDVTEIRQMQDDLHQAKDEAEAALEAKTQFLANMSHELRTPMNGIIGMIDLLDQTVETDEQLDYVDTLRKSSDALLTILNDILDLSKIQAGKLQVHESALELQAVMERIRALFIYRAEQKHIRFTYHITPHTPRYVMTDEVRLLQILSNLVANAIKFTNEGTVAIIVSSVSTDGEHHTLRFAVQDSGIGISSDNASLLFTNFTQLDTTPSKAYGGTGLGLSISRQLAELLGGEIGVLSDEGEGSVFWFTIAAREARIEDMPEVVQVREAVYQPFVAAPRVLLVDDNAINQKVGQRLLTKLGCEVVVAGGGPEAIALATADGADYNIIFMDIQMPDMDGVAATAEIRRLLGKACPPVVAMTAYSMQEDAGRFMRQGLDDYVGKPVKSRHLYEVLHRWLRPSQVRAIAELDVNLDTEPELDEAEVVVPDTMAATPPIVSAAATLAPAAGGANELTLDEAIVRQLLELGGAEFTTELYQEFEQEAGELLREAAPVVAAANFKELLPMLHQLKGTAATLGGVALAAQARHLEHELKHDRIEECAAGFQLLEHYFAQFVSEYPSAVERVASAANV